MEAEEKYSYQDYTSRLEMKMKQAKETLDKGSLKLLLAFADAPNKITNNDISVNRKYKRLYALLALYKATGKPFDKVTPADLEKYMRTFKNAHSKESIAAVIKSFYRHTDERKYYELLKCPALKVQRAYSIPGNVISSNDLLTEKECLALIQATKFARDKCLFSLLILGGFRIGETIGLKRKDLTLHNDKTITVAVNGKTGRREVRLAGTLTNYVRAWLDEKANKDADAYVFTTSYDSNRVCSYSILRKCMATAKAIAGIKKPLHFHLLRHRAGTWALLHMNRQLAIKRQGWTQNTNMIRIYSHVDDKMADEDYLQAQGLKPKTVAREFQEKECLMCGSKYGPEKEICDKCCIPLGEIRIGAEDAMLLKNMLHWFKENKGKAQ